MARNVVSAVLTSDYAADRGATFPGVRFRFNRPADLTDANVDAILTELNARRATPADSAVCPVTAGFKPRKLEFYRQDGNSVSFTLFTKGQAIAIADAVRTVINTATPANLVVCVKLIGEKWDDLLLELNPAKPAPTAGTPSRVTTGGKQYQHSGKITYQYDGPAAAATTTVAVKVDTDSVTAGVTAPPTVLGATWADCVGAFQPSNPCPSRSEIKPRRYLATLLVQGTGTPTPPAFYQQTQIPVFNFDAPEILACGEALAALAPVVCLGYKGEDNDRFHRLLP